MEYKLKKPLLVYDSKQGKDIHCDTVEVNFKGKKGLLAIRNISDLILTLQADFSAKFAHLQDKIENKSKENKENKEDEKTTAEDVLNQINRMGKSEIVFQKVYSHLKDCAIVGSEKQSEKLQNEMDIDDLEGLYKEVMHSFLLKKPLETLNSTRD